MEPEVWVAGRPLTSITYWGDLEVTHRTLGSYDAKWSMLLNPRVRPPQLTANADVRITVGSWPIWVGNLAEPNWSEGTFAAVGACRQGEGAICLNNATGQTTSIPDVAIDGAIARGKVNWTRPGIVSAAPVAATDQTDNQNYVAALLDASAEGFGQSWWVDTRRAVRMSALPTTPTAQLMPDNGVLGTAVEAQVGTVVGRYIDSTTHAYQTVTYGAALPEKGVDLTERGELSSAAATTICQSIWGRLQAQPGWTNGLTVQSGELRSMGGQPIPLWAFTARQMVRLLGVRDLRGLPGNTDVVIGESIWSHGEDLLRLNPVGKVARDFRSWAEAYGGTAL